MVRAICRPPEQADLLGRQHSALHIARTPPPALLVPSFMHAADEPFHGRVFFFFLKSLVTGNKVATTQIRRTSLFGDVTRERI